MEFKVGDRVKLTTKKYSKMRANPVWGDQYQCAGTVIGKINYKVVPLRVGWDNGCSNVYNHEDLSLAGEDDCDNPNFTFRRRLYV